MNKLTPFLSEIIEKYNKGLSTKEIAKQYSCNVKTVLNLLKINNIKLRTNSEFNRKYFINHNFFEKIDTEEKSYFLGLLYADGCNHKNSTIVSLGLSEKDKNILEIFSSFVQPEKPLLFRKSNNTKWSNSYVLVIQSRKISSDLEILGCISNKTHLLNFPTENQVPDYLISHFIRGYFDGDGSINNGKRKHFSFVGTFNFIQKLQILFKDKLNFNITKTSFRHFDNTNTVTLLKCGRIQSIKFGEWLYKDANFYLERKKIIFESYY
jgi:hypothetical protein